MAEMMVQDDFKLIQRKFVELTDDTTFIKEASFALQAVNKNKQLLKCSKSSVVGALINVAQIGLTLNPVSKLAYLVPRWNSVSGKTECCLEPSYQGLVKLITDTGGISQVYCYLVYKGDEFEEVLGSEPRIVHKPKRQSKEITHVYAVAVFPDGKQQFEIMASDEVELIRGTSSSYEAFIANRIKSCVWITHEGEMYRKTVIRRLCKYLPKSEKWDKVNEAISFDEQDYSITMQQESTLENLLISANISPEKSQEFYRELPSMSRQEADKAIFYLRENQVDPIHAQGHPSTTDAKNKLAEVMQDPKK